MNASIGLRRSHVFPADHSHDWSAAFAEEYRGLKLALSGIALKIEHVGSTAVPRLQAKPIIDIAVAYQSNQLISELVPRMEELGYLYRGDAGADGGHLFVKESSPNLRTHHLHVVEVNDPQWSAYLRFRDRLRRDRVLREKYGQLKLDLSKEYPNDRRSYTAAKNEFIEHVLASNMMNRNGEPGVN